MPITRLFLIIVACFVPMALHAETSPEPELIFLCIGQSNMAGRAKMLPADQEAINGVLLLDNNNTWVPASHPLNRFGSHAKGGKKQQFGPAGPFALALRKHYPQKTIGLIVNARGSTKIEQWNKGQALYNKSLQRAKAIKLDNMAGILWLQGCSNANDTAYAGKLAKLIANIRTDLGKPTLPAVLGQVPIYGDTYPINAQIVTAAKQIPHAAVATNENTTNFDKFHYDRKSYIIMGERMCAAFLTLLPKPKE